VMSNWADNKLNELGFVGRGKSRHRPRNAPILFGGEYPFIQTGDVKNADPYISFYSQTYNEKGLAQSKLWDPGTLCITIAANIAETAILKIRACFPDSIVGFIADPCKANVKFIKYYIDMIKFNMQNISHGTTQDNLSLDKLLSFNIPTPPIGDQHKIAHLISTYDDFIENSLRRINMLKEIARSIYNEWFIEFRFPGHAGVQMVDSPLGNIPDGWQVVTIGDLISLEYGKSLTKKIRQPGPYPVVGSGGISGWHNRFIVKGPGVVVGRAGSAGYVHWIHDNFFPIDSAFYVERRIDWVNLYYLYYLLVNSELERLVSGAAVPGINRNAVYGVNVILPQKALCDEFYSHMQPIFELIHDLENTIHVLHKTRDLLLPKLVSGEMDISELDINIEEEAV
jgi:type I restriction enzyme, S subunit